MSSSIEGLVHICNFFRQQEEYLCRHGEPGNKNSFQFVLHAFAASHPLSRMALEMSDGGYTCPNGVHIQMHLGPEDVFRHEAFAERFAKARSAHDKRKVLAEGEAARQREREREERLVLEERERSSNRGTVKDRPVEAVLRVPPLPLDQIGEERFLTPRTPVPPSSGRTSQRPKPHIVQMMTERHAQRQSARGSLPEEMAVAMPPRHGGASPPPRPILMGSSESAIATTCASSTIAAPAAVVGRGRPNVGSVRFSTTREDSQSSGNSTTMMGDGMMMLEEEQLLPVNLNEWGKPGSLTTRYVSSCPTLSTMRHSIARIGAGYVDGLCGVEEWEVERGSASAIASYPFRLVMAETSSLRVEPVMWWLTRIPIVPLQFVVSVVKKKFHSSSSMTGGMTSARVLPPAESSSTKKKKKNTESSGLINGNTLTLHFPALGTMLQTLELRDSATQPIIQDINIFQRLHRLRGFSAVGSAIVSSSLEVLQAGRQLSHIFLDNCTNIENTDVLSSCPQLKVFSAVHTSLKSIDWMKRCQKLEEVYLSRSYMIQNFHALAKLPRLRVLHLESLKVIGHQDVLFWLSECLHLQELNIRGCTAITDLSPLVRLRDLRVLLASGLTTIYQVGSWIASWRDLAVLDMEGCTALVDASALGQLETLMHVNLSQTAIRSLDWVAERCCVALETLLLRECTEILNWRSLSKAKNLTHIDVRRSIVNTVEWLSTCVSLQHINMDGMVIVSSSFGPDSVKDAGDTDRNATNPSPWPTDPSSSVRASYEVVGWHESSRVDAAPHDLVRRGRRSGPTLSSLSVSPSPEAHVPIPGYGTAGSTTASLPTWESMATRTGPPSRWRQHGYTVEREEEWGEGSQSTAVRAESSRRRRGVPTTLRVPPTVSLSFLTAISLNDCAITSIDWIPACPLLQHVSLSGCSSLQNLQPLSFLLHLKHLNADLTAVRDIQWISHCFRLTDVHLRGCLGLTDVQELGMLSRLEYLDLSHTAIMSLGAFRDHQNLETILLRGCKALLSFDTLSTLPQLRVLDLSRTRVSRLNWLAHCPQLREVSLNDCKWVQSCKPLQHMKNLQTLSLKKMELTDLSWLKGCKSLTRLYVAGSLLPESRVCWGMFLPKQVEYVDVCVA